MGEKNAVKYHNGEKEYQENLDFLSRTLEDLTDFPIDADIYAYIVRSLKQVLPAGTIILVNSLDPDKKMITLRAIGELDPWLLEIEKILDRPLLGISFPVPDTAKIPMRTGQCDELHGGIKTLSFGALPNKVCLEIERLPFFGKMYGTGISWKGVLHGATTFILPPGRKLKNQKIISLFIRQVAGYLQRRRAEEALQSAQEKYTKAFLASPDAIMISDLETGRFIEMNDATSQIYGYTRDEMIGKSAFELGIWLRKEDRDALINQVKTNGRMERYELIERSKSGKLFCASISADFITINNRLHLISVVRDITLYKELEEEMKHHERELIQFSQSLAAANKKLTLLSSITRHDINNQLTVLMGYLSFLEKKQLDPTYKDYFQKVATAADQISAMIRFTKEYEEIGVNDPIWQNLLTLVDSAGKGATLGQVTLKNELPANIEVFADPLIAKVFFNLMDNALRHGGKITTIRFSFAAREGAGIIVCEDDGDGVAREEKERIFDRGFGKNTGFGLAISREILDITGIMIKEIGETGKGAQFEIVVPGEAYRVIDVGKAPVSE